MRISAVVAAFVVFLIAGTAAAKLPALADEAKAKAAEAAAKSAWSDKVGLYQLCVAMDRVANQYRAGAKEAGQAASAPAPTPACVNPGPYVSQVTPPADKPLEASGAHSPPGMATSPPGNKATSAEMTGTRK